MSSGMFPRHVRTPQTQPFVRHNFLGLIFFWGPVRPSAASNLFNLPSLPPRLTSPFLKGTRRKYRAEKKCLQILLSSTQAGPGRKVKQEEEEISRNHVPRLFLSSVLLAQVHS